MPERAPILAWAQERRLPVMSELEFGARRTAVPTIAITGTNGKTSTVTMLASVMQGCGRPAASIGTLSGAFTTPEAPELQRQLAELADSGVVSVAIEVSSHALLLHRVEGTRFAATVFTNLGRDHLDLHGSVEAYFEAK